jgi:hypothetical protein
VVQFGDAGEVAPVPPAAKKGVTHVSGANAFALAWKGSPVNLLVGWNKGEDNAKQILSTLKASLASQGAKPVAQLSAARYHALILRQDGSLVAGYTPDMKLYALPPNNVVKGRLARISTSYLYSLGVDVSVS